jgi:LAO/AO transport system kinase
MLALTERPADTWRPPVLLMSAQLGEGVPEVVAKLEEHHAWAASTGALQRRRVRRAKDEVEAIAVTALRRRWTGVSDRTELDELAERVVSGELDPYAAADRLLDS